MSTITPTSFLTIPTGRPGSIGDAAMLLSVSQTIRKFGFENVAKIDGRESIKGRIWPSDIDYDRTLKHELFLYRSISSNLFSPFDDLKQFSAIGFIGADTLDGTYDPRRLEPRLAILNEAARQGIDARIFGSSLSEHPNPAAIHALRSLHPNVQVMARDEVSYDRFLRQLDRPVTLVADLAFLVEADARLWLDPKHIDWVKAQRSAGRRIVALNANAMVAKRENIIEAYSDLSEKLVASGLSLIFVPHDHRPPFSDSSIMSEIFQKLSPEAKAHTLPFSRVEPSATKSILGLADLLLSGRMHAAILAKTEGVPSISFGYAGKFEGFYKQFDLDPLDHVLDLKTLMHDRLEIVRKVLSELDRSDEISKKIHNNLGNVKSRSLSNFSNLESYCKSKNG